MNEIKLTKSKRKTLTITIDNNLDVIVKAPVYMPNKLIYQFVDDNKKWIEEHIAKKREQILQNPPLTDNEICALKEKARKILPAKVEYYSKIMGVKPTGIKITAAQKRFGSCNSKNSICFSYILMKYPDDAIDYVVVHELAHIKHHNHSKDFYAFVQSILPDYKEREKMLKK